MLDDCSPQQTLLPPGAETLLRTVTLGLWREPTARGLAEATDNRDARKVNAEVKATDLPIARGVGIGWPKRHSTLPRCCRRNEQRERSPTTV